MNEQNEPSRNDTTQFASRQPQHGRRRALAVAAATVIGAMSIVGFSYANDGPGEGHRHHGMGMHGPMDPANAEKHIDRMIERLLPDGTPEQKTRVRAIAKAAMNDLRPLREQHRAAREQAITVLSQPTIDRAALEKIRVRETQLGEQISRRMTQALADSAEVLTPEQRAKAAEHFRKRMEHRR